MDKSWISCKRNTPEFQQGVEDFIRLALAHQKDGKKLCCPCRSCGNIGEVSNADDLRDHIFVNGFSKTYTEWIWHGEGMMGTTNNNFENQAKNSNDNHVHENDVLDGMCSNTGERERSHAVDSMISDAEKPLYSGCTNYTRSSCVLELLKLKAEGGWSDECFTELLEAMKDMLPEDNTLPSSTYEAKKIVSGLDAEKIHACSKGQR